MPLKENEILDRVEAYVAGQIRLSDFSAWLYEVTWDMESDAAPRTQAFAYVVLGKVAERSTAGASEDPLRAELRKLASARRAELDKLASVIVRRVGIVPDSVQTASSAQVVRVPIEP